MDRRHAIWVLLLFILQGEPAEGQFVDVCSSCHPNATCDLKQDGSGLTCHCMYGFVGNGRTLCQDKDECQIGAKKICGPHAFCHNTLGSYQCTCVSGYSPSNTHTIFIPNDGTYCRDVDECLRTPGLCGVGARCVNLDGDFECVCLPGYTAPTEPFHPLRDRGSCRDVDECLRTPGLCGVGARCVNLDGDFECVCLPGYTAPTEPFHPLRDRGSCRAVDCGPPTPREGATLLSSTGTAYGSVALWGCRDGFLWRRGENVSRCAERGDWSGPDLVCEATCGPVPRLARAEVVWSNASMALHRCVDGYHSWRGSYVSVCGSTGDWQQATLRCTEVKPAIYDLQVFNESCVRWRADKFEADKEVYKVVYRGTRHYQATFHHERKQFLPSLDESVDVCLSLLPATNYTVSVSALSARFTATITTNTSLQAPQAPLIFYRELDSPSSLTLTLQRSAHTLDAISVYQVFVVPLDGTVVFDCKSRASPEFSPAGRSPTQYVAGQFPLRHMGSTQMNFTVGDGRHHGGFFNAPLRRGMNYYVILRVASHWQEGFQSSCVLWVKVKGTSHVMRMASLCAAGLIGALLLVVLLGYCYNWFFNRSDAL